MSRLELVALLTGLRSLNFVSKELNLEHTGKKIWTDSECVLSWLKSKKAVFIQDRITEISKDKGIQFRYINTKVNPADIASRGTSSKELKQCILL